MKSHVRFGRETGTKERSNPSQRETIQVCRKEALSVLWVLVGGRNSLVAKRELDVNSESRAE